MIVKAAAFVKRLNHDSIFPRWAGHERIDQFRRELRAQLDIALRVFVNTAAACVIHFNSSLYVCHLGQSPIFHISKVLAQWNNVCMVSIEISEIREVRVPIGRIDFPGDMVVVHHFEDRLCRYLLERRNHKTLRRCRHPVKPVRMRARRGR